MPSTIRGAAFALFAILLSVFVAGVSLLAYGIVAAAAQTAETAVAPNSIWYEVWTIVQPIATLLLTTVGSVLIPWLGYKLSSFLQAADEQKRKEIEQQLSEALHKSAQNALKFALAKLGIAIPADLQVSTAVVKEAIDYIRSKNPDAIDAFKLDDTSLGEIILSKVPDVKAIVAAGEMIGGVLGKSAAKTR